MKRFLAVLCMVALLTGGTAVFASCSGGDETIKVGVTLYEPMDYKDEDGNWIGFDAELAQKAFNELGYKVSFEEIDWDSKILYLNSGVIDCVWNGMTITDELKENILMTDPYLTNQQVVVVKEENVEKYQTKEDLAKASSIAFEGGSAAESELEKLNLDESKLFSATKQLDTFLEVKSGSCDIAVVDKTMAQTLCGTGNYQDLTYVDVGFDPEYFAVGFKKDNSEMCSAVNELLKKYAEDGTIAQLKTKYEITL